MVLPCSVLFGIKSVTAPRKWPIKLTAPAFGMLGLVAITIYFAQPQYFRRSFQQAQLERVTCVDLVRGCEIDGVTIKFNHQPQVMQPFQLKLQTAGAKNIYATFTMVGMQMGINRYRLLQQAPGSWAADIILPICAQTRSDWHMNIEMTKNDVLKHYQLTFTSNGDRAHSLRPE